MPFMQTFADKVAHTSDAWKQIGLIFQCVLAALVIYFLTKKVPELVTGLLSGQPSIGGASMVDMAKGAAGAAAGAAATAAGAGGAVRAASAIAQGKGKGGALGTLSQLGKAAVMSRGPVQSYRNAMQKMDSLVGAGRHSASNMRTNMRLGKDAAGRAGTDRATIDNLEDVGKTVAKRGSALSPREQKQYEQLTRKFNEMMERKYPKGKK